MRGRSAISSSSATQACAVIHHAFLPHAVGVARTQPRRRQPAIVYYRLSVCQPRCSQKNQSDARRRHNPNEMPMVTPMPPAYAAAERRHIRVVRRHTIIKHIANIATLIALRAASAS